MIAKTNVKINLGLNILRKRPDGYHDIETLFVPHFGLGDTLEIIAGDDYSRTSARLFARYGPQQTAQGLSGDGKLMITLAREEGVDWDPLEDLTVRAYRLLDQDFHLPPVKIFLEKTAPVGAGLGGGSADAAFALKMLNELFALGLPDEPASERKTSGEKKAGLTSGATGVSGGHGTGTAARPAGRPLADYAARLGSDTAFFLFNRPMIGTGRGEILREAKDCIALTPEPDRLEIPARSGNLFDLKVVVPEGISVSTSEAYKGIVPRDSASSERRTPLKEALSKPTEEWKDLLVNDFEAPLFAAHPELAALKQSLSDSGAAYASLSGSGPALFALYRK